MNFKALIVVLLIGLGATNVFTVRGWIKSHNNYTRMSDNLDASKKSIKYYKAKNGQSVAKVSAFQLKNNELKSIYPDILDEIQNLKIKRQRVDHYSETVITHEKHIATKLRDSVVYDTVKVKVFTYKDPFYDVSGKIHNDSINMDIQSTDTITQVVYKGKRRNPWLWVISRRNLEQVISSKNPNSTIVYSQSIKIAKK